MSKFVEKILQEAIELDIEKGDTILTGKFKNHKVVVDEIGEDEHGLPTVNGKGILKIRIPKIDPMTESIIIEKTVFKRVKSSNIKVVGYDQKTGILQLDFIGGGTYEYYDVPVKVYKDLMRAKSKGSYVYWNIAYEYDYDRLK